ncbi:hypothetical protein EVAR_96577_1 [Eumeta japonica]|uniref:Uncharacterized protein n=1 Tax=Eumeta variegata TaxID=151549 RepID=A0A4C1WUK0_EUMVA|nr:hypothetical protein EVAR_96577_1 [Eumeta japonica]
MSTQFFKIRLTFGRESLARVMCLALKWRGAWSAAGARRGTASFRSSLSTYYSLEVVVLEATTWTSSSRDKGRPKRPAHAHLDAGAGAGATVDLHCLSFTLYLTNDRIESFCYEKKFRDLRRARLGVDGFSLYERVHRGLERALGARGGKSTHSSFVERCVLPAAHERLCDRWRLC